MTPKTKFDVSFKTPEEGGYFSTPFGADVIPFAEVSRKLDEIFKPSPEEEKPEDVFGEDVELKKTTPIVFSKFDEIFKPEKEERPITPLTQEEVEEVIGEDVVSSQKAKLVEPLSKDIYDPYEMGMLGDIFKSFDQIFSEKESDLFSFEELPALKDAFNLIFKSDVGTEKISLEDAFAHISDVFGPAPSESPALDTTKDRFWSIFDAPTTEILLGKGNEERKQAFANIVQNIIDRLPDEESKNVFTKKISGLVETFGPAFYYDSETNTSTYIPLLFLEAESTRRGKPVPLLERVFSDPVKFEDFKKQVIASSPNPEKAEVFLNSIKTQYDELNKGWFNWTSRDTVEFLINGAVEFVNTALAPVVSKALMFLPGPVSALGAFMTHFGMSLFVGKKVAQAVDDAITEGQALLGTLTAEQLKTIQEKGIPAKYVYPDGNINYTEILKDYEKEMSTKPGVLREVASFTRDISPEDLLAFAKEQGKSFREQIIQSVLKGDLYARPQLMTGYNMASFLGDLVGNITARALSSTLKSFGIPLARDTLVKSVMRTIEEQTRNVITGLVGAEGAEAVFRIREDVESLKNVPVVFDQMAVMFSTAVLSSPLIAAIDASIAKTLEIPMQRLIDQTLEVGNEMKKHLPPEWQKWIDGAVKRRTETLIYNMEALDIPKAVFERITTDAYDLKHGLTDETPKEVINLVEDYIDFSLSPKITPEEVVNKTQQILSEIDRIKQSGIELTDNVVDVLDALEIDAKMLNVIFSQGIYDINKTIATSALPLDALLSDKKINDAVENYAIVFGRDDIPHFQKNEQISRLSSLKDRRADEMLKFWTEFPINIKLSSSLSENGLIIAPLLTQVDVDTKMKKVNPDFVKQRDVEEAVLVGIKNLVVKASSITSDEEGAEIAAFGGVGGKVPTLRFAFEDYPQIFEQVLEFIKDIPREPLFATEKELNLDTFISLYPSIKKTLSSTLSESNLKKYVDAIFSPEAEKLLSYENSLFVELMGEDVIKTFRKLLNASQKYVYGSARESETFSDIERKIFALSAGDLYVYAGAALQKLIGNFKTRLFEEFVKENKLPPSVAHKLSNSLSYMFFSNPDTFIRLINVVETADYTTTIAKNSGLHATNELTKGLIRWGIGQSLGSEEFKDSLFVKSLANYYDFVEAKRFINTIQLSIKESLSKILGALGVHSSEDLYYKLREDAFAVYNKLTFDSLKKMLASFNTTMGKLIEHNSFLKNYTGRKLIGIQEFISNLLNKVELIEDYKELLKRIPKASKDFTIFDHKFVELLQDFQRDLGKFYVMHLETRAPISILDAVEGILNNISDIPFLTDSRKMVSKFRTFYNMLSAKYPETTRNKMESMYQYFVNKLIYNTRELVENLKRSKFYTNTVKFFFNPEYATGKTIADINEKLRSWTSIFYGYRNMAKEHADITDPEKFNAIYDSLSHLFEYIVRNPGKWGLMDNVARAFYMAGTDNLKLLPPDHLNRIKTEIDMFKKYPEFYKNLSTASFISEAVQNFLHAYSDPNAVYRDKVDNIVNKLHGVLFKYDVEARKEIMAHLIDRYIAPFKAQDIDLDELVVDLPQKKEVQKEILRTILYGLYHDRLSPFNIPAIVLTLTFNKHLRADYRKFVEARAGDIKKDYLYYSIIRPYGEAADLVMNIANSKEVYPLMADPHKPYIHGDYHMWDIPTTDYAIFSSPNFKNELNRNVAVQSKYFSQVMPAVITAMTDHESPLHDAMLKKFDRMKDEIANSIIMKFGDSVSDKDLYDLMTDSVYKAVEIYPEVYNRIVKVLHRIKSIDSHEKKVLDFGINDVIKPLVENNIYNLKIILGISEEDGKIPEDTMNDLYEIAFKMSAMSFDLIRNFGKMIDASHFANMPFILRFADALRFLTSEKKKLPLDLAREVLTYSTYLPPRKLVISSFMKVFEDYLESKGLVATVEEGAELPPGVKPRKYLSPVVGAEWAKYFDSLPTKIYNLNFGEMFNDWISSIASISTYDNLSSRLSLVSKIWDTINGYQTTYFKAISLSEEISPAELKGMKKLKKQKPVDISSIATSIRFTEAGGGDIETIAEAVAHKRLLDYSYRDFLMPIASPSRVLETWWKDISSLYAVMEFMANALKEAGIQILKDTEISVMVPHYEEKVKTRPGRRETITIAYHPRKDLEKEHSVIYMHDKKAFRDAFGIAGDIIQKAMMLTPEYQIELINELMDKFNTVASSKKVKIPYPSTTPTLFSEGVDIEKVIKEVVDSVNSKMIVVIPKYFSVEYATPLVKKITGQNEKSYWDDIKWIHDSLRKVWVVVRLLVGSPVTWVSNLLSSIVLTGLTVGNENFLKYWKKAYKALYEGDLSEVSKNKDTLKFYNEISRIVRSPATSALGLLSSIPYMRGERVATQKGERMIRSFFDKAFLSLPRAVMNVSVWSITKMLDALGKDTPKTVSDSIDWLFEAYKKIDYVYKLALFMALRDGAVEMADVIREKKKFIDLLADIVKNDKILPIEKKGEFRYYLNKFKEDMDNLYKNMSYERLKNLTHRYSFIEKELPPAFYASSLIFNPFAGFFYQSLRLLKNIFHDYPIRSALALGTLLMLNNTLQDLMGVRTTLFRYWFPPFDIAQNVLLFAMGEENPDFFDPIADVNAPLGKFLMGMTTGRTSVFSPYSRLEMFTTNPLVREFLRLTSSYTKSFVAVPQFLDLAMYGSLLTFDKILENMSKGVIEGATPLTESKILPSTIYREFFEETPLTKKAMEALGMNVRTRFGDASTVAETLLYGLFGINITRTEDKSKWMELMAALKTATEAYSEYKTKTAQINLSLERGMPIFGKTYPYKTQKELLNEQKKAYDRMVASASQALKLATQLGNYNYIKSLLPEDLLQSLPYTIRNEIHDMYWKVSTAPARFLKYALQLLFNAKEE